MAHIGYTADICPEMGSRATKEADVRCDVVFDYIGCAMSDLHYLLKGWRTRGHLC